MSPGGPLGGLARLVVRRYFLPGRRRRPAVRPRPELLEPWEQEVDEHTAGAHALAGVRGFPYRPSGAAETPDGALAALRRAVGVTDAGQLFVVPAQTRPGRLGGSRRLILTPSRVLGFGPGGVALWVGAPALPGVRLVLRPQQVAAIETAQILLYARLTILATDARLNLHYNAVAADGLRPLVRSLRRQVAGDGMDVPERPVPGPGLPYKWRRLLATDAVLLDDGDPVAAVAGALPVRRWSAAAYAAVALTPRELVVLTDPPHAGRAGEHHGVDTHFVPRARIEKVRADGPLLRVRVCDADMDLPLGEELSTRAVRAFAGHLPVH